MGSGSSGTKLSHEVRASGGEVTGARCHSEQAPAPLQVKKEHRGLFPRRDPWSLNIEVTPLALPSSTLCHNCLGSIGSRVRRAADADVMDISFDCIH